MGDTPEIKRLNEDYILKSVAGRKITHFFSSEFYGDHVSRALGAIDRRIDPDRRQHPVSGTAIRADPFRYRRFLDPVVYRDLVTWVVFLGAPSTGKTSLCEALAERFSTVWMPEYGREYWERNQVGRRLSSEQLLEIAVGHRTREDNLARDANSYFFVDTDASTTAMFARYFHGSALPALESLAADTIRRCDLSFFCGDEIPYQDTADRSGEAHRRVFQRQIRSDLLQCKIPFHSLRGSLEQRLAAVQSVLASFRKWRPNDAPAA